MPLINCEINFILTCSANCFIIDAPGNNHVPIFTMTDSKLYVPVVTLSTQDNAKILQQLKSDFKRAIQDILFSTSRHKKDYNVMLDERSFFDQLEKN